MPDATSIALVALAISLLSSLCGAFCVLLMRYSGPVVARDEAHAVARRLTQLESEWDARQQGFTNVLDAAQDALEQATKERRRANQQEVRARKAQQNGDPGAVDDSGWDSYFS